jgi:hypothetical protein
MPTSLPYMQMQTNVIAASEMFCALGATITEGGVLSRKSTE